MKQDSEKLSALIIGCGRAAGQFQNTEDFDDPNHAQALALSPYYGEVYFYDIDTKKSEYLASLFGGHSLAELKALEEGKSIDLICVATPTDTHCEVVEEAIKIYNPFTVFLEKPACKSPNELNRLLELEKKTPIFINHHRRFWKSSNKIKSIIKERSIGNLVKISARYYGGIFYIGSHLIDFIYFLLETSLRPERISFNHRVQRTNDVCLDVVGKLGDIDLSLNSFKEENYKFIEMDLFFTKGMIRIQDFGSIVKIYEKKVNGIGESRLHLKETICSKDDDPILNAINLMAEAIKEKNYDSLAAYSLAKNCDVLETIWKIQENYAN